MSDNVLINTDIKPGESISNTPSTLVAGTDGEVVRNLRTDSDGILQVNLAVPTVSVTGINASVGTTNTTPPVYATQVAGTDGTVLRELHFTPPSAQAPATDPALIVTFSPNSPLPSGSNVIGTVTANLGSSGDLALDSTLTGGSQTSRLTDGTYEAALVPGAAGSGDVALVVGLSPNSPLPAGSNALGSVTANIGTTNGLALNSTLTDGSQHTKISNGGQDAAVKAASTAAAASDAALVVALSPNSPLPAGTNSIGSVTVVQDTASNLLSQVSQPTASALNATVVQATASNLLSQVSQPTASALNATVVQSSAASLNATAAQGAPASALNAWPVKNTDGTNTAAVKAANTASIPGDSALVVALSPNSPIPAGSNAIGTVTAVQSTASQLNATVAQPTAANLNATVVQGTAANLNATVVLTGTAVDATNGVVQTQVKPVVSATYSWSRYQNLGASIAAVVKATPGMVYSLNVHNNNSAQRYVQLFNATTTPAPGAVPLFSFLIPASGVLLMDALFFGQDGFYFSSGIVIACSTTESTYTAGTATDFVTHMMYA